MNKLMFAAVLSLIFACTLLAQPRIAAEAPAAAKAAPVTVPAKYEGGMLGYSNFEAGTLKFDDVNDRLVFLGKTGKELFSIPYLAILTVYPQSQSVTPTSGTVASHLPLPGAGMLGLIKEKRQYLIVQFDDPDVDVKGTTNFRITNKALLDSVIHTLGEKAKLTQRGDAYYRAKQYDPPSN